MNKRQRKKQARNQSKITKRLIRLTKRWTPIHDELSFLDRVWYIEDTSDLPISKRYVPHFWKRNLQLHNELIKADEEFETDYIYDYRIVKEPTGQPNSNGEYCDQSVGPSGDDFSGHYYIPIGNGSYFAFQYEC